ncbi:MAG TPA: hypothetical protein VLJ42_07540 [Solirubrobacteraceae bacterium]|nr:hypothetical protein [Solirubrobacteraceae bacterium]
MADSTVNSITSEQLPSASGRRRTSPASTRAPGTRARAASMRCSSSSTPTNRLAATPSSRRRASHRPVPQPASSSWRSPSSALGTSSNSVRSTSSRMPALPAFPLLQARRLRGSSR